MYSPESDGQQTVAGFEDGAITRFNDKQHPTPERTILSERKVPVLYYLCRNGQLQHPHFMEVPPLLPLLSPLPLRSNKSGFVWHDLVDNDFIHPSHGNEYVLKGSEILESTIPSRPLESVSFRCPKPSDTNFPVVVSRRNRSRTSIDLGEYGVYKTESRSELNPKVTVDAATLTIDKRRHKRPVREKEEELVRVQEKDCRETEQNPPNLRTELSREERSPQPASDSSPETLERLMQAGKQEMLGSQKEATTSNTHSGRVKTSLVLMQLISCGSLTRI